MAKLVIVESPAKAKTIGKYLGKDYEVTASMGHIRDLPKSQLGIDVEHDYAPQYINIKDKSKLIKELKAKAKQADGILLATDPDREGEAISWHLANILGLDPHEPNRVTFDEITKKGVQKGMANPRAIDEDLFNAQQARRILDRLVGYKLSPFLWRKVRRGLSAGRVQSVAVRLIDDREKEIENFKPEEYWNVDATLGTGHKSFTARLASDSTGKKLLPKNEAEARAMVMEPELVVADEPISALDVSIQAQIVNLLVDLQKKMGLTYLFVAHDLSMVKHISDRVAVLYLGTLVELTTSEELYANPRHPYTQALLSAIPIPDPKVEAERDRKKIRLEGEVPSPINTKPGCKFQGRCKYAKDICRQQMPELKDVGNNHFVACHFCDALEENKEL